MLEHTGNLTYFNCPGSIPGGTTVSSLNRYPQAVGSCAYPDGETRGYLFGRNPDRSRPYTLITIRGSRSVEAYGLNDHGQVVGCYLPPTDPFPLGFWWSNGTLKSISMPGARATCLHAITNTGLITGYWYDEPQDLFHGLLITQQARTTLDVPGARWTIPLDVNEQGQVLGWYRGWDDTVAPFVYEAGQFYSVPLPTDPHPVLGLELHGLSNREHLAGRLIVERLGAEEAFYSRGVVLVPLPPLPAHLQAPRLVSQQTVLMALAVQAPAGRTLTAWPAGWRPQRGQPLPW
jgi:hypothetical protein